MSWHHPNLGGRSTAFRHVTSMRRPPAGVRTCAYHGRVRIRPIPPLTLLTLLRLRRRSRRPVGILLATAVLLATPACSASLPRPNTVRASTPAGSSQESPSASPSAQHEQVSPFPSAPPADPLTPSGGPVATVYGQIKTRNNVVFITIDDGYIIDERVADLIEREHIPVTLFLVERAARLHLDFFKRLVAAGATVENHTTDHSRLTGQSRAGQQKKMCAPMDSFTSMFGRRPTLFRPPYGAFNQTTRELVRACGMSALMMWSAIMNNGYIAVQDKNLSAGELILMHFRTDLYKNLTNLLAELRRRNLTVGRLEDYVPPMGSNRTSPEPSPTQSQP